MSDTPTGSCGLTDEERSRVRGAVDLEALDALARALPVAVRSLVILRFAEDMGSDSWRREYNGLVIGAGLPSAMLIPDQSDWAISWRLSGDVELERLWDAVE